MAALGERWRQKPADRHMGRQKAQIIPLAPKNSIQYFLFAIYALFLY
jgi:hypothetical protein